jgi:hypothetical protein
MLTPTNLARLAAWCKMSHETHLHLAYVNKKKKDTPPYDLEFTDVGLRLPDPTDPGADPQLVDDVWAARLMWTLATCYPSVELHAHLDESGGTSFDIRVGCHYATTTSATLALLLAARAAGVPEVVAAMGDEG